MQYKKELHWWLVEDNVQKEAIRFKDRIEFKCNGLLHNKTGAAIKYTDNTEDKYYLNGEELSLKEWKLKLRIYKIKRLKEKMQI
jgi:hypothetical protein